MSDQDTKPSEAATSPVETTEAKVVESETTNPESANPESTSDASDAEMEEKTGDDAGDKASDKVSDKQDEQDDAVKNAGSDEANDEKPSVRNPPKGMLRTGGYKNAHGDARKNKKFDPTSLPETDNPQLIRTQVEFYFCDSNLPSDKHLWNETGGEENKPVSLAHICTFGRMRRFKPYSAVVAALKESKTLVIEGEEGKETVRRKTPYDPKKLKNQHEIEERSTYVKGFGEEDNSTQFEIEAFFMQYGATNCIRLRRADNKFFKGSVFVEWADKETADKFLALRPRPEWKGYPLLILSKSEYVKQKNEEIRSGRKDPNSDKFHKGSHRGHRSDNFSRGRGRGNFRGDPNDWKKRRDEDQRNGFDDRRGRRDHRGRGRGHRRGRGRDRGEYGRVKDEPADDRRVGPPKIHTSTEGAKIMKEEESKDKAETNGANGKRAREDDATGEEHPAKKVDQKETATEDT